MTNQFEQMGLRAMCAGWFILAFIYLFHPEHWVIHKQLLAVIR